MEYNTEIIARIAQQVAEVVKLALADHAASGDTGLTIADVETAFRQALRQIGAEALSQFLSKAGGTPETTILCECGGQLRYQRFRPATITTVFGKITYERAYYAGCSCGRGKAPVDEKYGLDPGAMSSGLAALLGLAGIEFGFEESRNWLERFLLFEVSENTVRSETQTLGELQIAREKDMCDQSQDEAWLQARLRATSAAPARLYGSIDAAKVRIEPRAKAGKKPEKEYYPHAVQIVDWYHAQARLRLVAQAAFAEGSARQHWLDMVTDELWAGQVEAVIRVCEHLAARCEEARQAVTCFTNNAARMRYDQFRAAGYLIGSGTVESGCKHIVTQRLKQPGVQSTVEGAVKTAKARAAWLSGEWDALCAQRAALPLAV